MNYTEELRVRAADIRERVLGACARVARDPAGVRLIAVSKRQSPEAVRAAVALGFVDFGENYVQELAQKVDALRDLPGLRWHMIGHLQSNKVQVVVPLVASLHALDSVKLIERVERGAAALGRRVPVFVSVNLGQEPQKQGCAPDEVEGLVQVAAQQSHLKLVGLMTIPPQPPEAARGYFRQLRTLAERHGLSRLSMGMSSDFEIAIEEGATDVRIGTALFGERP